MRQDLFNDEIVEERRPTFLKVLCILTFIGSGYGILNSGVTYFNAETISRLVIEAEA